MFSLQVVFLVQDIKSNVFEDCFIFGISVVDVHVSYSASVAISTIHLLTVVAISSFCNTKLVQSYIKCTIIPSLIAPVCGSLPSKVLTFFAQGQKSKLQAHVFAVVTFAYRLCPVV